MSAPLITQIGKRRADPEPGHPEQKLIQGAAVFIGLFLGLWALGAPGLIHWLGNSPRPLAADYNLAFAHPWDRILTPLRGVLTGQARGSDTDLLLVFGFVGACFSLAGYAAISLAATVGNPRPPFRGLSGRRLIDNERQAHAAASRAAQRDLRKGEIPLVNLHANFSLSHDRLGAGIGFFGAQGSGKTQAMYPVLRGAIDAARTRRDTCVWIHDFKGDFTSAYKGLDGGVALLAPWDARTVAWDVAPDLENAEHYREFARLLVQADDEKGEGRTWANGASEILKGLILALANRKPRWTWADLLDEFAQEYPVMRERAIAGDGKVRTLLNDGPAANDTTASYLTRFASTAAPTVEAFARADAIATERVSFRRFFMLDPAMPRALIVQNSTDYKHMAAIMLRTNLRVFESCLSIIPDTREQHRFLFADELPQIKGIADIWPQFFAVGRSKGCHPIYSVQDVTQLKDRDSFGPDQGQALVSMTRTVIFNKVQGDTQQWASEFLKNIGGEVLTCSVSRGPTGLQTTSHNYKDFSDPVIPPADFGTRIGPVKNAAGEWAGVRGFVLAEGLENDDEQGEVWRLTWPRSLPAATAQGLVPAPWTTERRIGAGLYPLRADWLDIPPPKSPARAVETRPQTEKPAPVPVPPQQHPIASDELAALDALVAASEKASGEETESDEALEHVGTAILDLLMPGAGTAVDIASTAAKITAR